VLSILGRRNHSTLIEHWNGSAWSVNSTSVVTGYAAQLTGVVDLSPSNAWAVGKGGGGSLLEHWNGTTWGLVPIPDPKLHAWCQRVDRRQLSQLTGPHHPGSGRTWPVTQRYAHGLPSTSTYFAARLSAAGGISRKR